MQVFCFGPDPGHFEPGTFLAWSAVGLQDGTPAPTRPSWRAYFDALHERLQYCTVRSEDAAELIAGSNRKNRPAVVPDPVFYLPPLPARLSSRRGKYRLGVALGNPLPAPSFLAALAGPELANRCPFNEATCLHPEDVASLDFSQSQLIRKSHFLPAVLQALRLLGDSVSIEFFGFGAMYGDRELAVQLASCLEGARVATGIPRDVDAMQALIASYDGLVLSRYHAAILALRAGRPFVVADPYWSESTGTSKLHQLMKQAALLQAYWADEASGIAGTGDLTAAITMMMQGEAENGNIYEALHQQSERHFDALAASLLAA
jgi:hypothetical protein